MSLTPHPLRLPKLATFSPSARLPRSLRGQFTLALTILSLLILACGVAALYALRTSSNAIQQLARERLVRMQEAQDMVRLALLIERETDRLTTRSLPTVQASYAVIVRQTTVLDRLVAGLADSGDATAVLDLHQANQLLRNTANVVAQLRESALRSGPENRNEHQGLTQFHELLEHQADAMVAAARLQSAYFDGDYRAALRQLVETSGRHQQWVLLLLASSLLFAWLVADVFLGRRVLRRLQHLSHHLQQQGTAAVPLDVLSQGRDEIGDMARAVDRFMADRSQLQLRTAELSLAKEHLVEQGRVLELIAISAPLAEILERLTLLIESQLVGIQGSVLLLDEDGQHLRHGAGPNLPPPYLQAIDGVRIGPGAGSCGTAVHRREPVVVSDIQADPLWADYRELAVLHGLRAPAGRRRS